MQDTVSRIAAQRAPPWAGWRATLRWRLVAPPPRSTQSMGVPAANSPAAQGIVVAEVGAAVDSDVTRHRHWSEVVHLPVFLCWELYLSELASK